jgi:type II secretory pathway pseudopilin PulG
MRTPLHRLAGWSAVVRRLHVGLTARRRQSDDDGFVLLESVVAIAVVTVLMAALTALFNSTTSATNHLRIRQGAIQLAESGIEQVRAYAPHSLVTGRDAQSAVSQYQAGLAGNQIDDPDDPNNPLFNSLKTLTPTSDSKAPTNSGTISGSCPAPAHPTVYLPTTPECQTVGLQRFWVSTYLGECYVPTGESGCAVTRTDPTDLAYLRAVIAVTWKDPAAYPCSNTSCMYVTDTLIDEGTDPTFDLVNDVPETSVLAQDLTSDVGDTGSATTPFANAPSLVGGGVPPFTWAATGLPPGLSMAADGTISGKITDPTATTTPDFYVVAVSVLDGLIQRYSASFIWTVWGPTITTPADQTTELGTPVNLPIASTCRKGPCTFALTNGPVGLTIDRNTGVISGTPTQAQTVTATVSMTDANGVIVTTAPFKWAVLRAATVCVSEISLANGSFEAPAVLSGAPNWMIGGSNPLLWDTTEPDNVIELWKNDGTTGSQNAGNTAQGANGGLAITAQNGTQWAELNANQTGALYQDLPTVSGQVLQWSVWHRGRYSSAANATKKDVMEVQIGSTTSQSAQVPTGQTTTAISDDPSAWVLYRGFYNVPAGQTTTRFQFAAISTASGSNSIGNFIDNLSLNNYVACLDNLPEPQRNTVGSPISNIQLVARRGSGNFAWSGGASLPAGLSISTDGLISGTPTQVGVSSVLLTLTDTQTTFEQSVSFTWTVVPGPTITAPPNQITSEGGLVNLQVTATCPNTPCSYTMANGPGGLAISNAGVITGTVPNTVQTFSAVRITVRDNDGVTATSAPFTWRVNSGPEFDSPGNQRTVRGAAVILDMSPFASGGTGSYRYTSSGLPSWLSINATTGIITGVAPAAADSTTTGITVTITDTTSASATTPAFSWTVNAPPTVTAPANQADNVGATVSLAVAYTCPNAPCTFTITGQPTGLNIDVDTAVISGTVGAPAQTYPNVRVTITDAGGVSNLSTPFTWTISYPPLLVTTPSSQVSTINTLITPLQLTVSGGSGNYAWSGSVPAGLTMTAGGRITGTPTTLSSGPVTLTVTDTTSGNSQVITFNWAIVAKPTVSPLANLTTTLGATISRQVTSTCPNSPCTYIQNLGPATLSTNASGLLTGTITSAPATFATASMKITDAAGATATSAAYSWIVKAKPTVTAPAAQKTTIGKVVSLQLTTVCSNPPCTYVPNAMPPGLSISATGLITGTVGGPAQAYSSSVTVTDAAGVSVTSAVFTWTVVAAPTVTAPVNQVTSVGAVISVQLVYSCPNTTCTFVLNNGPATLAISTAGKITGTITSAAQLFANVSVTIKDASLITATSTVFSWNVLAAPSVTAPANQITTLGAVISLQLATSCPNAPCTYALLTGPATLAINASGLITGTITSAAQTFSNVTVRVTDKSLVVKTSAVFTWTVNPALVLTYPGNQTVRGGIGDTLDLSTLIAGGTSPYTYSAIGLPAWLTLNTSTGLISGTAPSARSVTSGITVSVRDSANVLKTSAAFSWIVTFPSIAIPDQVTVVNTVVSVNLDTYTSGGTPPYSYTITNKPAWLTYTAGTHVLSGTAPAAIGSTAAVTVTVTDSLGAVVTSLPFNWQVIASTPLVWSVVANRVTVPNAVATALDVKPLVTNDKATYGAVGLPAGLTMATATGIISGTPTVPGSYQVTVTATDITSNLAIASKPFTWQVTSLKWATIAAQTSTVTVADTLDAALSVSLGIAPYSSYTATNLPTGLTINTSTGLISGTPTVAGTFSVTVTAADLSGATATSAVFSWTVS